MPPQAATAQRLTAWHVAATLVCAAGLFADIAEVALGNVLAAVFLAPPYGMAKGDLSLLLAAMFAGGACGAPVFGWLADRLGRRTMLAWALCLIASVSFAGAVSDGVLALTACRFAAGLAIGAFPPLTAAYLAEILPPLHRGRVMMACAGLAFLGAPAVILLVHALPRWVPGTEAWRLAMAAAGAVALLSAGLFALLPGSPRRDRPCRTPTMPGEPDAPGFPSRRLVLLIALYALGPWATLGFPLLSAAGLVSRGFAVGDSVLYAGLSMAGPAIGIFAVAPFVDRLDRRITAGLCAVAMAASAVAFAVVGAFLPLVLIGIAFNAVSAIYSAVLSVYGAEMFTADRRASATAAAYGVGRLVSIAVAPGLLYLLARHGQAGMTAAVAAAALASLLILCAGPSGTPRRPI